jgi:hypothetical protein
VRAADVGLDPSRRAAAVSAAGPSPDLESFFSWNTSSDEMRLWHSHHGMGWRRLVIPTVSP